LRALDTHPDAFIATDNDGRLFYANRAAEQLLGETSDALRRRVLDAAGAAGNLRVGAPDSPFARVSRTASAESAVELAFERSDGTRLMLLCNIAPLHDAPGAVPGALASLRDVTADWRADDAQQLLLEASQILNEGTEPAEYGEGIARLLVRDYAQRCEVHWLEGQEIRRLAAARADGVAETRSESATARLYHAVRSGEVVRAETTGETGTVTGEIHVPLLARGVSAGALTLVWARPVEEQDARFAQQLATLVGIAIDNVQLSHAAQAALDDAARQHERAVTILESISDAFWAVDREGRFTYVNHRAEKVLGFPRADLIGKRIRDDFPRAVGTRIRAEMRKVREEQAHRVFEVESPNHETWLEVHIYPTSDDGLSVYLHDIGERKQAADAQRLLMEMGTALTASLDYELTLREAARIAVPTLADFCTVDLIGPNESVQRVAAAAIDRATEETLLRFGRRHPPDTRLPSAIMRAIRGGESILFADITPERLLDSVPDPELLRMVEELGARSTLTVPLSARGKRLGVITFAYARSGRRYTPESCRLAEDAARRIAIAIDNARLYEEAQESSRAKSNFISVMSHEFRTPLTAIVGYTDLLFAEVAGVLTDKQKVQLGRIKQSAWHLTQLIEEVLTFSRVDAGREKVQREPVNMAEIASKVAALIEPVALEKNLRLVVDIPSAPLLGQSDPGKVRQILINLLSNAVKFTEKGEVRLRVREAANRFIFQVEDTGIGIADEHRDRIFDSFWQVEQGTTRAVGGTGLGLTITRRLANLLGGDVDVASQLGRGSTFTVWLPAPERAPPSHPLPGPRSTATLG
jgi:PAS domain S-box-containing protein